MHSHAAHALTELLALVCCICSWCCLCSVRGKQLLSRGRKIEGRSSRSPTWIVGTTVFLTALQSNFAMALSLDVALCKQVFGRRSIMDWVIRPCSAARSLKVHCFALQFFRCNTSSYVYLTDGDRRPGR